MKISYFAVLVRGFYINLTGKPYTVVSQKESGFIPNGAMIIEIDTLENEKSAASNLNIACETWKKSNSGIKNNAAVTDSKEQDFHITLPSCIALTANGKPEVLFWTGCDLDCARKRLSEKDDSPLIENKTISSAGNQVVNSAVSHAVSSSVVNSAERANVVKNRIALVTGGAQGIGEEIVRNLAAAGALVFIADLNFEGAKTLVDKINANENRTASIAVKVNVASEESVEEMFDIIAETAGGFDICISNAGVLKAGSVLEQDLSDFKFVTDINYTGFFVISKFAGRLLRTQHFTAPLWKTDIIQVNSKSGLEGSNKNGAYAGGKFGGLGLVASFAMELVEYGIKVNAVCPGNFLDGPLWSDPEKGLFVQYLRTGKVPGAKSIADVRTFYESKVPMKRGCTGKDLVRAIYYIIEQEYETGQAVPVTGGQIMLH